MKTFLPKVTDIQKSRKWFLVDAEGKSPGRIAAVVSKILQGKHKVDYSSHLDGGDGVVIINAKKIELTGNKEQGKEYHTHSGRPGNLKTVTAEVMLEKNPTKILYLSISGMLPKNRHRKNRLLRLKIFAGGEHTLEAQKPERIVL